MKITFIANACAIFESQGVRIMSDPWLYEGAFHGSWGHETPLKTKPDDVKDVDALYISHIHPDHYCRRTLRHFRPDIPIYIYDHAFGRNFLGNALRADGFTDIRYLKHQESAHFGPFKITMLGPWCLSPFFFGTNVIDSAMILEADGQKILNSNDATPTLKGLEDLRSEYGTFDVALLQYNAAGPYPACFFFREPEMMLSASHNLQHRNINYFLDMMQLLKPKAVIPFAGQYRLIGRLSQLNEILGTVSLDTLSSRVDRLASIMGVEYLPMIELDTYDIGRELIHAEPYFGATSSVVYDYDLWPSPNLDDLSKLCEIAGRRMLSSRAIPLDDFQTCMVSIHAGHCKVWQSQKPGTETLDIFVPSSLLMGILLGKAHWNNAEIGCHMAFDRDGVYRPNIHMALSYFRL